MIEINLSIEINFSIELNFSTEGISFASQKCPLLGVRRWGIENADRQADSFFSMITRGVSHTHTQSTIESTRMRPVELTEASTRYSSSARSLADVAIQLKPHQLSLLHRCLVLEN